MTAPVRRPALGDLADELIWASEERHTVAPPSTRYPGFDLEAGYRVAGLIADRRYAQGWAASGIKIGLTYRPVWDRIGVTNPFWSIMYQQATSRADTDFVLETNLFISPRIEVELVFGLKDPLTSEADPTTVRSAIDTVALGIEIVDSHYPRWEGRPADLIADHGCHAGLMVGEPIQAGGSELDRLNDVRVEISDGDQVLQGLGSAVLGGPVRAACSALPLLGNTRLERGHLISSGSLTGRSHPVRPGQRWTATAIGTGGLRSLHLDCV